MLKLLIFLVSLSYAEPSDLSKYKVLTGGITMIPNGSYVEGSSRYGGLQPDYYLDFDATEFNGIRRLARSLRNRNDVSFWDKIKKINNYISNNLVPNGEYENRQYRWLMDHYKKSGTDIPISKYVGSQCGVCRENALIAHHFLREAGIENYHAYSKVNQGGRIEPHAFTVVPHRGELWVVDPYNYNFNGYKLADLMNGQGVDITTKGASIAEKSYTDRKIVQIESFPKIYIPNEKAGEVRQLAAGEVEGTATQFAKKISIKGVTPNFLSKLTGRAGLSLAILPDVVQLANITKEAYILGQMKSGKCPKFGGSSMTAFNSLKTLDLEDAMLYGKICKEQDNEANFQDIYERLLNNEEQKPHDVKCGPYSVSFKNDSGIYTNIRFSAKDGKFRGITSYTKAGVRVNYRQEGSKWIVDLSSGKWNIKDSWKSFGNRIYCVYNQCSSEDIATGLSSIDTATTPNTPFGVLNNKEVFDASKALFNAYSLVLSSGVDKAGELCRRINNSATHSNAIKSVGSHK